MGIQQNSASAHLERQGNSLFAKPEKELEEGEIQAMGRNIRKRVTGRTQPGHDDQGGHCARTSWVSAALEQREQGRQKGYFKG